MTQAYLADYGPRQRLVHLVRLGRHFLFLACETAENSRRQCSCEENTAGDVGDCDCSVDEESEVSDAVQRARVGRKEACYLSVLLNCICASQPIKKSFEF